jgi:hypothetical protein
MKNYNPGKNAIVGLDNKMYPSLAEAASRTARDYRDVYALLEINKDNIARSIVKNNMLLQKLEAQYEK